MPAHRDYETTVILVPDIDDATKAKVTDRMKSIIEEQFGGQIQKMDDWGRRDLAYDIRKGRQGVYVYTRYSAPGDTITELERILRITDPVMKFLTVRLEALGDDPEPSGPSKTLALSIDQDGQYAPAVDSSTD